MLKKLKEKLVGESTNGEGQTYKYIYNYNYTFTTNCNCGCQPDIEQAEKLVDMAKRNAEKKMKEKRVKPTKEQWHELNRLLDDVVRIGHTNERNCRCRKCTKLNNYSKSNGLLDRGDTDDGRWDERKLETKHRHEKDAIKVTKLAYQGCKREEIANRIGRSRDYVSKLAVEFDIEIRRK